MKTTLLSLSALATLGLAACSTPTQTTGPQIHPGDLVRQQRAAQSGTVTTQPAVTNAVATMAPGASDPSAALAAFDQFCTANAANLRSAGGQLQAAGYTLWKTIETSAVGTSETAQIWRKSGAAHAVFLQSFAGTSAPYVCGVDSPDTPALRQAIGTKMAGKPTSARAAQAVGAQNVWDVNGTAHVSAVSVAPKYEWGPTRSFALVARSN